MVQGSSPSPRLNRRVIWIVVITAVISVLGYLLAAGFTFRLGFPLDDAWIHQTYARNLVEYGEWSFIPHQTSGGSTAPLWSVLLAPGFLIGLSPLAWTYLLGMIILIILALLSDASVRHLAPDYHPKFPWVGIFMALEWHLVWAAASGMETLLSGLLVTLVLVMLALGVKNYLAIGLLIGISVWVRPDLATLLGPAVFVVFLSSSDIKNRLAGFFMLLMGFGVILTFYLFFNLFIAGTPFPNTFYAKQAEYGVLQNISYISRFFNISLLPVTGAGVILLPGVILMAIEAIKKRNWAILAGLIWFLGYIALYAWRLPVTYQHGRYLIPAMPIFFLYGLAGMSLIRLVQLKQNWKWILLKVWQFSTGVAVLAFWLLGARAYATDVAVIESEMVATAHWVSENIPSNALIAAHDIGALGFFAPRNLLDLAGLVSPEVIPFIRDEIKISHYLDQKKVEYLITFPDWYPNLVDDLNLAFSSRGQFAPKLGQENMSIYYWSGR
jgi:hypothetical protein